jgi:rSAM/selenodomain-associated transferase 2
VKLSVVIPALDEAEWIAGAVESARSGAPAAEGFELEVLVVDGGSRDATPARAAAAGARVLRAGRGRARQLARGVELARGEVVVLLHADTRLPPGWAAAVRDALADPSVAGGAFRFRFEREGRGARSLRLVEWGARLRCALLSLPYGDQALFARRDVLESLGGVPQAPILEDLDLVKALRGRGRLAQLALPATTSPRRYLAGGVLRTMLRHWAAATAWVLGVDRERVAAWYRR